MELENGVFIIKSEFLLSGHVGGNHIQKRFLREVVVQMHLCPPLDHLQPTVLTVVQASLMIFVCVLNQLY